MRQRVTHWVFCDRISAEDKSIIILVKGIVMGEPILALPVSVEQIAAAIKQMSPASRQRLLDLVPELGRMSQSPARTLYEAHTSASLVREQVQQALAGQGFSPDDPFWGELTLGQYLDLPDEERAQLWESPTDMTWSEVEERDAKPDALPAR